MKPQLAAHPSLAVRLFGSDPARRLTLLRAAWPLVVGPELARRTEVLEIKGTTLRVRVPDAAWRKVLHGMQATLRARLRAVVGELAPARFGFQESAPADALPGPPAPHAAALGALGAPVPRSTGIDVAQPPDSVRQGASAIADAEIRERFLHTAARALARARHADTAASAPQTSGERPADKASDTVND